MWQCVSVWNKGFVEVQTMGKLENRRQATDGG